MQSNHQGRVSWQLADDLESQARYFSGNSQGTLTWFQLLPFVGCGLQISPTRRQRSRLWMIPCRWFGFSWLWFHNACIFNDQMKPPWICLTIRRVVSSSCASSAHEDHALDPWSCYNFFFLLSQSLFWIRCSVQYALVSKLLWLSTESFIWFATLPAGKHSSLFWSRLQD
jgi:hypothetical protein